MPANTLVRDVMSSNVVTLRADQTVAEAADVLAEHRFGAMPVIDADGRLLGLLRDEDLIVSEARVHVPTFITLFNATIPLPGSQRHLEDQLQKVAGSTVADVMDEDCWTIAPDASLEELATVMHERDASHIPVIDADGKLVGIVARGDLVRFIARTT
jgi:CBS domain-containing protein